MKEIDKKYLKYLSIDTLDLIQECLEYVLEESVTPHSSTSELYNVIENIISEKSASEGSVMAMDFTQYKKSLEYKNEVKKATKPSTDKKLNVWDFLLNIREYIKEADTIQVQPSNSFYNNVTSYRMFMKNRDVYHLVINASPIKSYHLIQDYAFILIKNPDADAYTQKIWGNIEASELNENNPLNLRKEDIEIYIQYITELCNAKVS